MRQSSTLMRVIMKHSSAAAWLTVTGCGVERALKDFYILLKDPKYRR